jgi:DNA-binding LacI/PurR family transcriptional regulator
LNASEREHVQKVADRINLGDWTGDLAYELGMKLLGHREFTAVFASNDQMALGIIHAAHDLGLSVPHDLSVVGFDDIPEAQFYTPPLTTVRQDFAEIGRRSLALMLEMMDADGDGDGPRSPAMVVPELIRRASTAPALR